MMKSFLNYVAPKMIWLNILQNVAIDLFKYFGLHIMTCIVYYKTNQNSVA